MSLFNSPISTTKATQIISALSVERGDRVLDVGCGSGEFLIQLIEATGATGLGIDLDSDLISAAQIAAADRIPDVPHEFRVANIQDEPLEEESFALGICIGSTHAFGDGDTAYPNTIRDLSRLLRPGGQMLIGECYWKQPPAAEYLNLIGEPVGVYRDHLGNITYAEQNSLIAIYAATSNEDEWDHFEWSHRMKVERQASMHPNDPDLLDKARQSRKWLDGYLRWGRSTMGFGFYLFQKTDAT